MQFYLALINDQFTDFRVLLHEMEGSFCPSDDTNDVSISSKPVGETNESSQEIPTPQQLARVNFDSYTCKLGWSSRGDLLAVSTEARVHVYSHSETEMRHKGSLKHAECLYDWQWCGDRQEDELIVTTGRYQPVHLHRVGDEDIRIAGTYKCINHLDELAHAYSVTLHEESDTIVCGLKGEIRMFDVRRPGRESVSHVTRVKHEASGQAGIMSCLAVSPSLPVLAAGNYDRTVGLYTLEGERLCVLRGQQGGLTQVTFTEDGGQLLAGGRKDNEIICWDLRQPGQVLWTVNRVVTTNQTIAFSLRGRLLVSANTDGSVRAWDVSGHVDPDTCLMAPVAGWALHSDAVTGVSWHPTRDILATSTGQRHCSAPTEGDSEDEEEEEEEENCLALWDMSTAFKI